MSPIWLMVNCNTTHEAKKISEAVLEKRLAACFDIYNREFTKYFWPPKSGKVEEAKGALLILETFESKYKEIHKLVKKLHSDKLPFIGFIRIEGVSHEFKKWMEREIET